MEHGLRIGLGCWLLGSEPMQRVLDTAYNTCSSGLVGRLTLLALPRTCGYCAYELMVAGWNGCCWVSVRYE